ncbi:PREDICTED: uncharacterized protein LOC109226060 [Nicotiana attenuata]|uniref:Uncharacterized protein n=1 Tax=Nicotiana attenuata TaxID=49451 RepID=A0A1J6IUN5_NICAT|nr:PREDICTED: uncharacterized protein LOC109226060 [Nicotiana attenuata]OIT07988.1 hypothetical protein A4A49_20470 [Nicotiana attenuata]
MRGVSSFPFLLFFLSFSHNFIAGFSDDSSNPKNGTKTDTHAASSSHTGSTILVVCLALVVIVLLSFFLFKFWQKKKREEQYARLLKLFEEDDELELELGLRD